VSDCRLGVVALGDSITNGHGGMQSGLGSQSWAQWLAQALELPFTKLARDGATARDVVAEQAPRVTARYDLGCLYVGVNDVRAPGFDAGAYARDVGAALAVLADRCDRVLAATVPRVLGVPPALPGAIAAANAAVTGLAADHGAAVVDLSDFAGARWVWADRVHATATGQVELADRAARALGAPEPSRTVVSPPRPDLAYAWHFGRRAVREHARAAWIRGHLRATGRLPGERQAPRAGVR
jgi:lysophospholipase L1-like esterase